MNSEDDDFRMYANGFKYGLYNCKQKRKTGFSEYVFNLSPENWQNPSWEYGYKDGWKMFEALYPLNKNE